MLQGGPRDDGENTAAAVGGVIGGVVGGVATGAAITGTAVATAAVAPVAIVGAGVVAGAVGVGFLAKNIYRWFSQTKTIPTWSCIYSLASYRYRRVKFCRDLLWQSSETT